MVRRYLSLTEAGEVLRRGESVECFVGAIEREGERGIRWLSIRSHGSGVEVAVYESADLGSGNFTDVHEFWPLDDSLEFEDPAQRLTFCTFSEAVKAIESSYPGSASRLVNELVVQEEYADFISSRRV